jgi:hypothetical protein
MLRGRIAGREVNENGLFPWIPSPKMRRSCAGEWGCSKMGEKDAEKCTLLGESHFGDGNEVAYAI